MESLKTLFDVQDGEGVSENSLLAGKFDTQPFSLQMEMTVTSSDFLKWMIHFLHTQKVYC